MPRTLPERRESPLLRLAAFAPPLIAFASVAFIGHPTVLVLLLFADAMTMIAVCRASGFQPVNFDDAATRGLAYCLMLATHTVFTALLVGYPLLWLLREGSLTAALVLSGAGVIALIAMWRTWPAFGLLFAWKAARPTQTSPFVTLRRALACAWKTTEESDLFFSHGLIVALCLLLLSLGALILAGIFGAQLGDYRVPVLTVYAIIIAPLAQWLIVHRCADALLVARRRARQLRTEACVPAESPHVSSTPAVEPLPHLDAPDLDTMLLRCIRAGQVDLALAALERGADPNATPPADDRDRRPPLVLAAVSPDLRLLRGLIVKGADLNRNDGGLTPLLAATRDSHEGRPDAVMTLLTNGADPHCADAAGNTPLHYAALAARPIVAALLCDAEAPLNAINHDGLTPIGVACAAANWELAKFLLERGAKVEVEHAQPALIAAASIADDDPQGVKLLLKRRAQVDSRGRLARTALMTAALHGHVAIAKVLLDAGAQIDLADSHGTTALMEAARSGAVDVLELFAGYKPSPDLVDAHGRTALIVASQSRQACEQAVKQLLALGASPHIVAGDGRRAVDYAASAGRWNIVAQLDPQYPIPASLAVAESTQDAAAHLLDALRFAHWPIVENFAERVREWPQAERAQLFTELIAHADPAPRRWLLNHGLDANATMSDGTPLLQHALLQLPDATPAAFDLLAAAAQPAGMPGLSRICAALCGEGARSAELEALGLALIERGAEIFASDSEGRTPLAHAAASGSATLVQALLARGVDPNMRDRHGRTPLFDALQLPGATAAPIIKALLAAGADPESAAANGETPLGLALVRSDGIHLHNWLNWTLWKLPQHPLRAQDLIDAAAIGDIAAVEKLLALGLPVDGIDAQGATALVRASGGGHAAVAKLLIEHGADPAHATASGATPLSAAVSARRVDAVDALLASGAAVDQRLPGGGTALMIAAALGSADVASQLLARHAQVNASDERGIRALHAAAQFAFASRDAERAQAMFELLLDRGAEADARNNAGQTALMLLLGARMQPGSVADQRQLLALLPLLLARRADLNAQDQRGVSALHACAMHGLLLPARALLAAGADPQLRDVMQRTPRQVAHLLGFIDVAAELGSATAIPGAAQTLRQPARS